MKVQLSIIILFLFYFTGSLCYSQINSIEQIEPSKFNGKIGSFDIYVELNNINDQIIGWYNYPGKSTKLRLEGSITSNGEIELKEFNYRAKHTGYFEGIIDKNNTISGEWSNPEKTKLLPFSVELSNGVSLIQLNSETSIPTEKVVSEEIVDEEKRKMFQESKVKGFSKLALWIVVGLLIVFVLTIYFLLKNKKKALEKEKAMYEHTKKEHYQNEHTPPTNQKDKSAARIGYEFEKLVVDLFPKNYYKIKYWSSDKISNNHATAEASEYPDLLVEFKYKDTISQFAVECKYREFIGANGFEFEQRQLDNYNQFEKENNKKVFVAIGVAGTPYNPKEFYLIPLSEIISTNLPISRMKLFSKKYEKCQLFYNYKEETLKIWKKEINYN